MSILKSQDLFSVYQPETGLPSIVTITNELSGGLDKSTGEVYDVTTTISSLYDDDGEEANLESTGNGLKVSLKFIAGVIVDKLVSDSGTGYTLNEIVTPDTGSGARLIITEVGENGEALAVDLYLDNGGTGYEITDVLIVQQL